MTAPSRASSSAVNACFSERAEVSAVNQNSFSAIHMGTKRYSLLPGACQKFIRSRNDQLTVIA
jgi:hypothetical protein